MRGAEQLLSNPQRTVVERSCAHEVPLIVKQDGQAIETLRRGRMFETKAPFPGCERPSYSNRAPARSIVSSLSVL
jgi:hypothetical protein